MWLGDISLALVFRRYRVYYVDLIALLAFSNPDIIQSAKMSILLSSLLAGATGFVILNRYAFAAALITLLKKLPLSS